jgi:hypothetical protein
MECDRDIGRWSLEETDFTIEGKSRIGIRRVKMGLGLERKNVGLGSGR